MTARLVNELDEKLAHLERGAGRPPPAPTLLRGVDLLNEIDECLDIVPAVRFDGAMPRTARLDATGVRLPSPWG